MILGEDKNVVAHAFQDPGKQALLGFVEFFRNPLGDVVVLFEYAIEKAAEDVVLDLRAVPLTDLGIDLQQAPGNLLEHARNSYRVVEPENTLVAATKTRASRVEYCLTEDFSVAVPGHFPLAQGELFALDPGGFDFHLGSHDSLQLEAKLLAASSLKHGEADDRSCLLVL